MHAEPLCDDLLACCHGVQRKEVVLLCSSVQRSHGSCRAPSAACSVEAVMREDRMLKAYEILELYLELLAVGALAGRPHSFAGD